MVLLFGVLCVCAAAETNETTLSGQQLSLGDDLDMKFYVAADADTTVHVSVDGKTTAYDLRGKAPVADGEGKGTYEIVVSLSAAQMTSRITLNFKQGGEDVQISSSVREYADRILEGEYSDSTKTLVRAMLNYGAATQMYFYHNPYDLATKGLDMTDMEEVAVPDQNYATILHAPEGVDGITFHGASLVLKSQTTLRCYFKLDAGKNISAYDFEGKQVQSITSNGEVLYYVDITDIAPQQLDAAYTVYINGQAFVSYNPMAYIQRVYHKDTTADLLKKLMKALYGYYEAAIAYVYEDNATVTLPTATGGTITADKNSYKLGDTVTLTVTPDAGYSQKLFINGQPLLLDWKTNTYRFVAEENIYNITGGFVPSLPATPRDASRWDTANQAHGILNTYYPTKDDAWLVDIGGEYSTVSTKAKNYLAGEDGNGGEGFAVALGFKLSNGKEYIFRIIRQNGKYYSQRFGINGSDWTKQELDAAAIAAICGEGANFKLDRTAADTLTISVNGVVYDTYKIEGATEATKVTAVILGHYGNKGEKIQIPFVLKTPTDAPDVQLNIPELTGGTVTPAYDKYLVGDTVTLMITPDAGYSQKLYINGEAVLLDWKTNAYSFEAKEEVYNITGSFEPSLDATAKDANRWDTANQAHGILNAYYPNKDDAWLLEITDEYRAISVKAKNYLAGEDGNGGEGFAVVLGLQLSDGKTYSFRVVRENGTYYWQRFGIAKPEGGNDWTKKALDAAAVAAICGDGADFKVERTASDTLTISVNGVVCDTYKIAGMALDTTVTKAIIGHYGNRGQKVELPFALETGAVAPTVELHIADMLNGTVTSDKEGYKVGDTITLTAAPAEGYVLKSLTVKKADQVVEITKLADGKYSFAAEDVAYTVEAEFAEPIFTVTGGKWDLSNQYNGSITILNKTADGSTVKTNASNYKEVSVTVKDYTPSKNEDGSLKKGNFSMQVTFIFDNGKQYQVRIHNTNDDGIYKLQNMGDNNNINITGWKWLADLTAEQKAKLLDGDGVKFTVKLVGPNAELWVDGTKMKDVALGDEYSGKLAQITLCMNGNKNGQNIEIPFELKTAEDVSDVQLSITEPANGTVAADKETYQIGDTVTLTVTPAEGYSQKLYINGEPMLVNANGAYSFEATEKVYNITGSFEPSLSVSTNGRWYATNQAHGILNAYYPNANDAWKMSVNGEYNSLAIMVKNFLPQADTMEGDALGGFSAVIGVKMDNGNIYSFRIINKKIDGAPQYQYSRFGGDGKAGWGGKCVLDDKVPGATDLINGDGIEFKVTRTGDNTLALTLNGVVLDTYTMDGITADNKVSAVLVYHYGNKGENVEIPFELK